jgi:catechol 2,3-dioxygenase-like lactoylglutathione lyase family enzyme
MITGVNHLTLSVGDLEESANFYAGVLGFRTVSRKDGEVHSLAGDAWVVLILDSVVRDGALPEYTHTALSISADDFATLDRQIRESGAEIWQENRTEGDSLYFLDPDGHKLEIHASDLGSRIESKSEDRRR